MNSLTSRAAETLLRLEDPEAAFGADSLVPRISIDVDGAPFPVYDGASYENGASGASVFSGILGSPASMLTDGLANYSQFILRELHRELRNPTIALPGLFYGALFTGRELEAHDSTWMSLRPRLEASLRKKARSEISTIRTCIEQELPLPGFESFDLLRGLARDTILLTESDHAESWDLALDCAEALALLLAPSKFDVRLPNCWVVGAPFYSGPRAHDRPPSSHINMGVAHGSAGVLLAVTHAVRAAATRNVEADRVRTLLREIEAYCLAMQRLEKCGALPMYAAIEEGRKVILAAVQQRPSWCYGTTGNQLSMLSAGLLLDSSDLVDNAKAELVDATNRLVLFDDMSICHGSSGLALTLATAGSALDDEELIAAGQRIAYTVAERFDSTLPYCFVYASGGLEKPVSVPGLFNGAAGIAAALLICRTPPAKVDAIHHVSTGAPWTLPPRPAAPGRRLAENRGARDQHR